jgi:hypothetical protein
MSSIGEYHTAVIGTSEMPNQAVITASPATASRIEQPSQRKESARISFSSTYEPCKAATARNSRADCILEARRHERERNMRCGEAHGSSVHHQENK